MVKMQYRQIVSGIFWPVKWIKVQMTFGERKISEDAAMSLQSLPLLRKGAFTHSMTDIWNGRNEFQENDSTIMSHCIHKLLLAYT